MFNIETGLFDIRYDLRKDILFSHQKSIKRMVFFIVEDKRWGERARELRVPSLAGYIMENCANEDNDDKDNCVHTIVISEVQFSSASYTPYLHSV